MKYRTLCQKHPNRFIVAVADKRNKRTGFVSSWKVLNVQSCLAKAEELQEYYKSEGLSGVVIIDSGNAEDNTLPCNRVAEMFRVYFGLE